MQIAIDTATNIATVTGRLIWRAVEPVTVTRADGEQWGEGVHTLAVATRGTAYASDTAEPVGEGTSLAFELDLDTDALSTAFAATVENTISARLAFLAPSGLRLVAQDIDIHRDGGQ